MDKKKEEFIKMVQSMIDYIENEAHEPDEPIYYSIEAKEFFEEFKKTKEVIQSSKTELTENGKKILSYMQQEKDNCKNSFTAKGIAEGIFSSSRSVSGSMRKLITEGYVEKISNDPVAYKITDLGANKNID